MKALVLFSALMAVSAASVGQLTTSATPTTSASNVQVPLHSSPLTTDVAMIPKCFPYCGG